MPDRSFGIWPYDRTDHAVLKPFRRGLGWVMTLKPRERKVREMQRERLFRPNRYYPADPVTQCLRRIAHERGWAWRR